MKKIRCPNVVNQDATMKKYNRATNEFHSTNFDAMEEWVYHSNIAYHSIDREDHTNYFTFATAIKILDELEHSKEDVPHNYN